MSVIQSAFMWDYLHRLVNEERWELLIRFFMIPVSIAYANILYEVPAPIVLELLEFSSDKRISNWIKENILSTSPGKDIKIPL